MQEARSINEKIKYFLVFIKIPFQNIEKAVGGCKEKNCSPPVYYSGIALLGITPIVVVGFQEELSNPT